MAYYNNQEIVNKNTTLMVIKTASVIPEKTAVLTYSPSTANQEARLLSIKGTSSSEFPLLDTFGIFCSTGTSFKGSPLNFTEKTNIQNNYCASLMEYPANVYNIVNYYQASFTGYVSGPPPGTTVVNVSGSNSIIFADLRSASKVFVLPPLESLTSSTYEAPYFVFKDAYGTIATNTWYISTSGGIDSFEGLGTTLEFTLPNQAIEIVGQRVPGAGKFNLNRWLILGGYNI